MAVLGKSLTTAMPSRPAQGGARRVWRLRKIADSFAGRCDSSPSVTDLAILGARATKLLPQVGTFRRGGVAVEGLRRRRDCWAGSRRRATGGGARRLGMSRARRASASRYMRAPALSETAALRT